MTSKLNKAWHLQNRMPPNPTKAQRAEWHLEHLKYCGCRKPTPGIKKLFKDLGVNYE